MRAHTHPVQQRGGLAGGPQENPGEPHLLKAEGLVRASCCRHRPPLRTRNVQAAVQFRLKADSEDGSCGYLVGSHSWSSVNRTALARRAEGMQAHLIDMSCQPRVTGSAAGCNGGRLARRSSCRLHQMPVVEPRVEVRANREDLQQGAGDKPFYMSHHYDVAAAYGNVGTCSAGLSVVC